MTLTRPDKFISIGTVDWRSGRSLICIFVDLDVERYLDKNGHPLAEIISNGSIHDLIHYKA